MDMNRYDVIIIGGGPAGLFCAINCGGKDRSVLLLEKTGTCGSKLLISGSGQCNITHEGEIRSFPAHYGRNGKFLLPALHAFSNRDLIAYLSGRGVPVRSYDDGKVFPVSRRSREVLDLLIHECTGMGIQIRCGEPVVRIDPGNGIFKIMTPMGRYQAYSLVIATGGASYPATGSSGDGYRFAASVGHTVIEPAPALTPVYIRDFPFSDCAGLSFPTMAFSVWRGGKKLYDFTGDVLFTHRGLSGPGILDHSRSINAGDEIRLSFAGAIGPEEFGKELSGRLQGSGRKQVSTVIRTCRIPVRLIRTITEWCRIPRNISCARLSYSQRSQLIAALTAFPLAVESLGDFSIAMVTRGGVALTEVHAKTMESRLVRNLYFAGEVLDIDGDTGGYNLQAAFSTGWVAARSIRNRWNRDNPGAEL